jgi:steroid delta-isomerase-like uncharacterized protein
MKKNLQLVESYYNDLWNRKDISFIDQLFDDNIIFRASLGVETRGKEEFLQYFEMITTAIPNLYHSIEAIVADENQVAARALYNGTHQGKLMEFEATNNRIRYHGTSFFQIKESKIFDIWVLGDLNTLYEQLQ